MSSRDDKLKTSLKEEYQGTLIKHIITVEYVKGRKRTLNINRGKKKKKQKSQKQNVNSNTEGMISDFCKGGGGSEQGTPKYWCLSGMKNICTYDLSLCFSLTTDLNRISRSCTNLKLPANKFRFAIPVISAEHTERKNAMDLEMHMTHAENLHGIAPFILEINF